MRGRDGSTVAIQLAVCVLLIFGTIVAPAASRPAEAGDDMRASVTVDGTTYESIQAAVDAAPEGSTVTVGPGTYRETVVVDKNVTVVGSPDAVLAPPPGGNDSGQQVASVGITVPNGSDAAPTIRNLTLRGFGIGVLADGTSGDWVVANATFDGSSRAAISARETDGAWRVRNTDFRASRDGVYVSDAAGNWSIEGSTFENNTQGLTVIGGEGAWTVRNSTFVDNGIHGIGVSGSDGWSVDRSTFRNNSFSGISVNGDGDWTVTGSTFVGHQDGVQASYTRGDWEIRASRFEDNDRAITANSTTAEWTVRRTAFVGSPAVVAADGDRTGDARRNWWGPDGSPESGACVGNVTCGEPVDRDDAGVAAGE